LGLPVHVDVRDRAKRGAKVNADCFSTSHACK
jgi:hypothetical protein